MIPENESFKYSSGSQYICSSIVVKFWKEAGILGDLKIEPLEFTSKDVYQMNLFETDPDKMPCKIENSKVNYCIVYGNFIVLIPDYNSVMPYDHMNEKCPFYIDLKDRPDTC